MISCLKNFICTAVAILTVVLGASGCTTALKTLERENKSMLSEIARLKADKANLQARAAALEDETLVLEKKAGLCTASSRPALAVVRLQAEEAAPSELVETLVRPGERPVLSLGTTAPGRSFDGPSSGGSGQSRGAPSAVFGAADNLGVLDPSQATSPSQDMDLFNEGYRLYANAQYSDSLDALGEFVAQAPSHAYADDALYWRGECYLAMGKQLRAVGELERLMSRYPKSDKAASALWRIGYAYDKLGDTTQAIAYYFRVVDEFPATDVARKASQRVAVLQGSSQGGRIVRTAAP